MVDRDAHAGIFSEHAAPPNLHKIADSGVSSQQIGAEKFKASAWFNNPFVSGRTLDRPSSSAPDEARSSWQLKAEQRACPIQPR